MDTRNRRMGPWNSMGSIISDIEGLEAINVKCLWFESIGSGASGSITPPTGGTILLDEWAEGVDVLVSGISDLPTFEPVFDTAGAQITGTLDVDGNWTINGAPDTGYPIALVYSYEVALENYSSASCLESAHLVVSPAASRFFFGTFIETFDALITATGGVVTMSLEQAGGAGGDLTTVFSSGQRTFDCTPIASATLTAGSDDSPTENFVYILETDPNTIVISTSEWPGTEHIKICYALVPSAAYVETQGAYIVQNWNDHRAGTDLQGHLSHICETIRLTMDGAHWHSGIDGNGDTDGYITIVTGDTPDSVYFKSTAGVVYQMHKHSVPAIDTSGSDDIHVVNSSVTPYNPISDIGDEVSDSLGGSLSGRYYNIVVWGLANKTGEYSPLMMNLPSGSYNSLSGALADSLGYDIYSIPREFKEESTTGFLICRITLRHQVGSGGTYTVENTVDLRGRTPGTASGSAIGSPTTFADNQFEIFNVTDNTKVIDLDLSNIATGTTRTIEMPNGDMIIPTGTFAGATELNYAGSKRIETIADGFRVYDTDVTDYLDIEHVGTIAQFSNSINNGRIYFYTKESGGTERNPLAIGPASSTFRSGADISMVVESGKTDVRGTGVVEFEITSGSYGEFNIQKTNGYTKFQNVVDSDYFLFEGNNSASAVKTMAKLDPDGAAEMYYAGVKAFETLADGVKVQDTNGTNPFIWFYNSSGNKEGTVQFSAGSCYIDSNTGYTDADINLRTYNGSGYENMLIANGGGAVDLYYDGAKALETTTAGIAVFDTSGDVSEITFKGSGSAILGEISVGADLSMKARVNGGDLYLKGETLSGGVEKILFKGDPDGAAELYHTGLKVLETHADGITVLDGSGTGTYINFAASGGASQGVIQMSGTTLNIEMSGEPMIQGTADGNITLYYNGAISLATVASGGVYITGDCSALSFTDRTPFYDGPAIEEINKIKGVDGKIDHKSLPDFARVEKNGMPDERDIGAMISILVKAVQELSTELDEIKNK